MKLKIRVSTFALALPLLLIGTKIVWGEAATPEVVEETEDAPAQAAPSPEEANSKFKDERQNLMQILAKEIAPNLPVKDVEKLQRTVQRLGSYRSEWASSAKDLLVANAPVSELILYRYAFFKNPRLNTQILDTLNAFDSPRFPRAALAFAELLGVDQESKSKTLRLMSKSLNKEPSLGPDMLAFITGPWGAEIPLEEKLRFMQKSCGALRQTTPQAMEQAAQWASESQSFWSQLLSQEVVACLKGR